MNKTVTLTFYQFLSALAMILLFTFVSCGVEELPSGTAKIDSELISEVKSFTEKEMNKNPKNLFLTSFPLTPDWERAIVDTNGDIRVPMNHEQSAKDVFELFITKESGSLAGAIIQFMPYEKFGETKFHRILFSLKGKRETDLMVPKSFFANLQNTEGKKSGSKRLTQKSALSGTDEQFAYLCSYFRDFYGNPAEIVVLRYCPDGLFFNSSVQVCDWPEQAGEHATKSYFLVQFSNDETTYVSTYGFLEELEEVIVQNNYQNPANSFDDSSSFWVSFPPNFSYPASPIDNGGSSGGYYPIGELPIVTTKAQELRTELNLTTSQFNLVKEKPDVANSIFDFLLIKNFSEESKKLAFDIIDQMMINIFLSPDIKASYNSPFIVDLKSISNLTPEERRFNKIYTYLTYSPQFKSLFLDIFDGPQTRFNVKFQINEHVYEDNDPSKKEVNATTFKNSVTNILTIKISEQILIDGVTGKSDIEIAKTILHECVHAYLFIKANNPNVGLDITGVINSMYPNVNDQHNFMYNKMIPIMQNVLSEIRDNVTTQAGRNEVESLTMHPTINPLTSSSWIWNEYYRYIIINGLEGTDFYKVDFPKDSAQLDLLIQYLTHGHSYLKL